MPRSSGVTASAGVVIAGSGFTFLLGAMMLLGSAVMPKSTQAANVPIDVGSILIGQAIFVFAFAGWGLATGVGLLLSEAMGQDFIIDFRRHSGFPCAPSRVCRIHSASQRV